MKIVPEVLLPLLTFLESTSILAPISSSIANSRCKGVGYIVIHNSQQVTGTFHRLL